MTQIENRNLKSQIFSISVLKDPIDTTQIRLSIVNAFSNVTGEAKSKNQQSLYIPTMNSQRKIIEKIHQGLGSSSQYVFPPFIIAPNNTMFRNKPKARKYKTI